MAVSSPRTAYQQQGPVVPTDYANLEEQVRRLTDWAVQLQTTVLNGFIWLKGSPAQLINAVYDPVADQFNRLDTSKVAWLIEFATTRDIPGETNLKGISFWQAVAGTNPIGAFGSATGWLLNFSITSDGTLVMRGDTIEVDGNGFNPYGRFIHYRDSNSSPTIELTGTLDNIFGDFSGKDDATRPSFLVAHDHKNDKFIIRRWAAGNHTFASGTNLMEVSGDGSSVFIGPTRPAGYTVATVPSAASFPGYKIYVSDETGGPTWAISNGVNWLRDIDHAVIS